MLDGYSLGMGRGIFPEPSGLCHCHHLGKDSVGTGNRKFAWQAFCRVGKMHPFLQTL